jgi:hypothetical protein
MLMRRYCLRSNETSFDSGSCSRHARTTTEDFAADRVKAERTSRTRHGGKQTGCLVLFEGAAGDGDNALIAQIIPAGQLY